MKPWRVLVVMPLGTARGGGEQMPRQLLIRGRGSGAEWVVLFLRDGPMVAEARAIGSEAHVIESGLLVLFGDDGSLADAILRYLGDHAFAARVGAAARIRAAAFDDRTYAANVIAVLRESVP